MLAAANTSNLTFWWPILAAGISAVFIALGSAGYAKFPKPTKAVGSPNAWTVSDSWATNISVLGGIIGTAAGASGGLQQFLPNSSRSGFIALTLLFGGSAALSPIAYSALATSSAVDDPQSGSGTVAGVLAAAIAALFGAFGEIYLGIELARHVANSGADQTAYMAPLALGVLILGVYAFRSVSLLLKPPSLPPAAAQAGKLNRLSLMSANGRASGTL